MLDVTLTGTITAETDISVSPPDHSKKIGLATIQTLPQKSVWQAGQLLTMPYIPASSIRGALRNNASRALAAARARMQNAMTPDDYLLVAKGGIKDRKTAGRDERVVDYEAAAALRKQQPLISLFGAMAEKIIGKWQVGEATPLAPLEPNHKGRGVRSHPFQREPELAALMDKRSYEAFLETDAKRVEANIAEDKVEGLDRRIWQEKRRPEPDLDKIEAWKTETSDLKAEAEKLRQEAGGVVNVQQVLGGWEAIPAGTEMSHRMRLREVTEEEMAFALFALRCLARQGRLGAHESSGEGYISAEYDIKAAEDGGEFVAAGTLRVAEFRLDLISDHPSLRRAFDRSATILEDHLGTAA